MQLDKSDKIMIGVVGLVFVLAFIADVFKQEKISKANIEIETRDYVYYSYKETIKINPNSLCIGFYNVVKEYNMEHCGEYTVKYIK